MQASVLAIAAIFIVALIFCRAFVERLLSPGYGWCERCRRPWSVVRGHVTPYSRGSGCFPLCEACWSALDPQSRLRFYRAMWQQRYEGGHRQPWSVIEAACLHERQPMRVGSVEEGMRILHAEPWEWEAVTADCESGECWLRPQLPLAVQRAIEAEGEAT